MTTPWLAMKTRPLLALLLALATGCYPDPSKLQAPSSDAGTQDSGGSSVLDNLSDSSPTAERCKAFATAFCTRFRQCTELWFRRTSLEQADCERGEASLCQILADLPGSTQPTVACIKGYEDFACPLIAHGKQPTPCYAPGNNAEGQGCSHQSQCQGRRCVFEATAACGTCTSRVPQDGACENNEDCQSDLTCYQKRCTAASQTTCTAGPCQPGLRCGADGTCGPLSTEGGPCTTSWDCDVYAGFVCGTKLGKCVRYNVSPTTCGQNADGSSTFCAGSMACSAGACLSNAKVGESCSDEDGPYCESPALCDSTMQKCRMPVVDTTCGVPEPISGPPTNMAAEISGPAIGYATQDNEKFRKRLSVTVIDSQPKDLTVGEVWGLSPSGGSTYLPIPITNSGNSIICTIVASTITVLDQEGKRLGNTSAKLMGSVRTIATTWENTCLGPGETGYLLTIVQGSVFPTASSVQIAFNGTSSGAQNDVHVTPVSYATSLSEQSASLAITVKNTGSVSATLGTKSQFLVLDDAGPISQGQLSAPSPGKTLSPGETTVLTTPSPGGLTQGHGHRVRVFIDLVKPVP